MEADTGGRTAPRYHVARGSGEKLLKTWHHNVRIAEERPDALFVYSDVALSSYPRVSSSETLPLRHIYP